MKKVIRFSIFLFLLSIFSQAQVVFTPYAKAASYIGKGKSVMLELGTRSCVGCKKMNTILEPFIKKHPSYLIFDVLINEQPSGKKSNVMDLLGQTNKKTLEEKLKLNGYPYQIFYDKSGAEAYRHAGVLSAQQLESVCHKLGF